MTGTILEQSAISAAVDLRYEPFPLNDLQRAYVIGRNPALPLGGIGCSVFVEFERHGLDPGRLERMWNFLIRRHENLRLVVTGKEQQQILPRVPWYRIPVTDLANARPDEVEGALAPIRRELSAKVHDAETWPLYDMRVALLPGGVGRLFFEFDLIGSDAASMYRIFQELAALYEANEEPDSSAPPIFGYRESRVAEDAQIGNPGWLRAQKFWRDLLPSMPEGPQLPFAVPLSALTQPEFRRHTRKLDRAAILALEAAGAAHRLPLAAVVNAAFAEIIAAWSEKREFLLNLPLFLPPYRDHEVDQSLGNYTSNLLVAADMTSGSFAERGAGLSRAFLRALRHRAYSGVRVLHDLHRLRGGSPHPVAPVVLTNMLQHRHLAGAWQRSLVCGLTRTPQVVLDHQVLADADTMLFHWDVVERAFPDGIVEAMADAHVRLLERLAADPSAWTDRCLSVLPPAQSSARQRVNATARTLPHGLLHEGFFASARSMPDRPALIHGDKVVTYAQMKSLAAGVSSHLIGLGVEPGEPVACAVSDRVYLAAAALGTLACGAVYAPLDPTSPLERRRRELGVLKPRVALVDSASRATFAGTDVTAIDIDAIAPAAPGCEPAFAHPAANDRAYVIFTSGTTADPKAIVIGHRAAANTCADLIERFAIGPEDRILGLSQPTFDLSIFDMFGLWSAGGCLVVPAGDSRLDPKMWFDAIADHKISIWNSVPAIMTMLATHCGGRKGTLDGLRLILLSGDWIPPSLVPRMMEMAPAAEIVSLGGATEASIWSIMHRISAGDASLPSIPYGTPLANQTIHVLDETLTDRPDHVEGDIFIGGVGLAECYLDDAQKTAEAFLVHPKLGARIYRTGDRGRYRSDGSVEFLGRRDTQLKVQGFRIEAGEIESVLRDVDGVAQIVVEAVGDRFESKRLVAFVLPTENSIQPQPSPGSRSNGAMNGHHASLKQAGGSPRKFDPSLRRIHFAATDRAAEPIYGRRSARSFLSGPVAFDDLAAILAPLRYRETESGRRYAYPSASGLYPVQFYLCVKPQGVAGLAGGLYYVDPAGVLVLISRDPIAVEDLHVPHNRGLAAEAAFTVLMFAHMPAIAPSYGPLARDLCLLEAGYAGQALMEAAARTGSDLCPIGAMGVGPIAAAAMLGPDDQFVHAFVGGVRAQAADHRPAQPITVELAGSAAPSIANLVERLREHANKHLPAHMRPHDIVLLDKVPLSANGKMDRRVLRDSAGAPLRMNRLGDTTNSELERRLIKIAAGVLDVRNVDLDREFFAMGADSVKLVELAAAIEREFGYQIQIVDAFAHPTIRKLAAHLASAGVAGETPSRSNALRRAKARRDVRERFPGADGG